LTDSIYNRLLKERIIWLGSEVRDDNANAICAQMLLLAAEDPERDIYLYINSPGGSGTRARRRGEGGHVADEQVIDGVDIAANARSWGLDVLEVHTIAEFKEAYRKAEASDRPTMIHIETDLYGPNPPGSSWWDVPVSGVSELESTQRAYEESLRDRKPQRHYL